MDSTQRDRRIAGRYRLLAPIGDGGSGQVWAARDEVLGREVAVMQMGLPAAPALREGRLREARSAARIASPYVGRVFDVVEDGGQHWIVTERVPGRSLADLITERGHLPSADVVRIAQQLVMALTAAHEHGVLHRDVTPANVLLRPDGNAVLIDFGTVAGSPEYLAPERLAGAEANPSTDLWSLGCLMYAAAFGRSPFDRGDVTATQEAVRHDEPALPGGPLTPVLRGLLAKNPALRVSAETARLMLLAAAAGVAAAEEAPALSPPPVAHGRHRARHRRRVLAVAATVLVVAAAVTATAMLASGEPTTAPEARATASTTSAPEGVPDPTRPVTTPVPSPAPDALPAGFRLHVDDTGFAVAVPVDWTVSRDGSRTDFVEPGGGRFLRIDQTQTPKPDPVADWQEQEVDVSERLGGYSRIRIEPVDYRDYEAADWEFTWQTDAGALHVLNRNTITGPERAYALYWSTPEGEWVDSLPTFDLIAETFQPAA